MNADPDTAVSSSGYFHRQSCQFCGQDPNGRWLLSLCAAHRESLERAVRAVADAVGLAEGHRLVVAAGARRVRLVVIRDRLRVNTRAGAPRRRVRQRAICLLGITRYAEQASSAGSFGSFSACCWPQEGASSCGHKKGLLLPQQSNLKAARGVSLAGAVWRGEGYVRGCTG